MPGPDPAEKADLLRRILDHDQGIETLTAEIKAADAELRDMRRRLKDAVAARAKLSQEIRKPTPILGGVGEDLHRTMAEAAKAQRAADSRGAKPKGWKS
jgi:predicted  nucleic acid-binding Zn-ribbon protein